MLAMLLHSLPGTPFVYQGEEIGMTNMRFPHIEDYNDPDAKTPTASTFWRATRRTWP